MLQFNSTFVNSRQKLFLYWRIRSLLNTNVIKPEIRNDSKEASTPIIQDHGDLSISDDTLQNTNPTETKFSKLPQSVKKLQDHGDVNSSVTDKITNKTKTSDLINIIKKPGISLAEIKEVIALISKQNVDENMSKVSTSEKKESTRSSNNNSEVIHNPKVEVIMSKKSTSQEKKSKSSKIISKVKTVTPLSDATPSLIKALKNLSFVKNRNIPQIKSLTSNIATYGEELDIRMCGDILYSLSALNYIDEQLINKVMLDLIRVIPQNKTPPIFGSIVTSIAFLRYKDDKVLDTICKWAVDNYKTLRVQDIVATLQCFATFGYRPQHMKDLEQHILSLTREDITDDELWLDYVWSLTILGQVLPTHIELVLNKNFIKNILHIFKEKPIPKIIKLLNIKGAAEVLIKSYNGSLKNESLTISIESIERRKQKTDLVILLDKTLNEIAPHCFKTNVNTNMGFFIDAECYLNSKNEFVTMEEFLKDSDNKRLAIMVHDYHEYTRGKVELLGKVQFYNKILKAINYKVLNISYNNFSVADNLVKRVKYLKDQINLI